MPEFRLKSDAVPGLTTKIRLTPNRLGHYQVVCAELCGLGHSTMRQLVRVVEPPAFDKWLTRSEGRGKRGGMTERAESAMRLKYRAAGTDRPE